MSEEINNPTPEAVPAAAPVAAPAAGSAEYNAQMIARSGNVPEKFVDANSGEVNMEAFVNSYKELEKQFHGGQQAEAPATPVAPAPEAAPSPEAAPVEEAAPEVPAVDELALRDPEPKAEVVEEEAAPANAPKGVTTEEWTAWKMEIMRSGDITAETKATIKERLGLPEEVINDYVDSQRAQMRAGFSKAADVVGGQDSLSKIFGWASNNLDADTREVINAGLAGPAWETTLRGLEAQYNSAQSARPKAAEMTHSVKDASPAAPDAAAGFASLQEFQQLRSDPRYGKDRRYTEGVNQRAAMTNWRSMG